VKLTIRAHTVRGTTFALLHLRSCSSATNLF